MSWLAGVGSRVVVMIDCLQSMVHNSTVLRLCVAEVWHSDVNDALVPRVLVIVQSLAVLATGNRQLRRVW